MKTLDEVIQGMECCESEIDSNVNCTECPYAGIGQCSYQRHDDALEWLKKYRAEKEDIYNWWVEQRKNEALTWEELEMMVGEPIWLEMIDESGNVSVSYWRIIKNITGRNDELTCINTDEMWQSLWKKKQGIEWQAYRRERLWAMTFFQKP